MSDEGMSAELARLRAEHRQVRDLLVLIQELTSRAVRSESVGDLFSRAFPTPDYSLTCMPLENTGVRKTRSLKSFTICSYRKKRGKVIPNEPRTVRNLSSLSAT